MKKEDKSRDRALGLDRPITRRDFLNGIAIGTAALAYPRCRCDRPPRTLPIPPPPKMRRATTRRSSPVCAAVTRARSRPRTHCATASAHPRPKTPASATTSSSSARASAVSPPRISTARNAGRAAAFSSSTTTMISAVMPSATNSISASSLHLMNGGTLEIDSPRPYGPVAAGLLTTLGIDVPQAHQEHPASAVLRSPGTEAGRVLRSRDLRHRQAHRRYRQGGARASDRASAALRARRAIKSSSSRQARSITCPGFRPTRKSSASRA